MMHAQRTHVITLIHRDHIDHDILLAIYYCLISTTKTVRLHDMGRGSRLFKCVLTASFGPHLMHIICLDYI